jgi:hypothetical protein
MANDELTSVEQLADDVYDAIRMINGQTRGARLPAPVVYSVLGDLQGAERLLAVALTQLATGLARSLREFEVYESGGGEPSMSAAVCRDHLAKASGLAVQLADELEQAQSAIAHQRIRREYPAHE